MSLQWTEIYVTALPAWMVRDLQDTRVTYISDAGPKPATSTQPGYPGAYGSRLHAVAPSRLGMFNRTD